MAVIFNKYAYVPAKIPDDIADEAEVDDIVAGITSEGELVAPEGELEGAKKIIREVISVDAVSGLRDVIVAQQSRVKDLEEYEGRIAGVLPELTKELLHLKAMFGDVIRFQTNMGVLKYMQQETGHSELLDGMDVYKHDFQINKTVATATKAAMKLLNLDTEDE